MWNLKIFGLLLLGSCGVLFVCSEPVASEETTVENDAAVTLSTELMPPPLPAAGEHRGIVYLINLFAVRNKTAETPDEKAENALTDDTPEVIGPLASLLVVVDDEDGDDSVDGKQVTFDDLARALLEDDYASLGSDEITKELEIDARISDEPNVAEDKPVTPKKSRRKRTLFKKCRTCGGGGGGGGYGGGYNNYPTGGGGGGYPTGGGGGQTVGVIPIVILPIGVSGGGGGGRGHGGGNGGGNGYHPNGGGGGNGYYPSGNGGGNNYHPSGNGGGNNYHPNNGGWGGGGGGNSYSQASAQAQASASSSGW